MSVKDLEQQAINVGCDRDRLKKRLMDARATLRPKYKQLFRKCRIDYHYKCMFSDDDEYVLQWRVRERPDKPVSAANQQTNCGVVALYHNFWKHGNIIPAIMPE